MHILRRLTSVSIVLICATASLTVQEKGQWVPGQFGLNARRNSHPGFTCANLAMNVLIGSEKSRCL